MLSAISGPPIPAVTQKSTQKHQKHRPRSRIPVEEYQQTNRLADRSKLTALWDTRATESYLNQGFEAEFEDFVRPYPKPVGLRLYAGSVFGTPCRIDILKSRSQLSSRTRAVATPLSSTSVSSMMA
jgi:hypothetical protein